MKKLIVDVSSVLSAYMHLPDEEFGSDIVFEGKQFHIPDLQTCMERAEQSFQGVLDRLGFGPEEVILVRDPESPGAARKRMFAEYKGKREKRPPAYYEVYNKFVEDFCEMAMRSGAICATPRVTPTVEADDLINVLAERFPESTIYTRDKDLLACPAAHHLIDKDLDPMPFPVPREYIHIYRTIVTGDTSDNIPGCKGFGPKAWDGMLALIGPEGVQELELMIKERRLHELAEDVGSFKKFQLLIDQADDVYLSYRLMSFLPVPDHKIKWKARVTDCTQTLVTASNYAQCLREVKEALRYASHAVIDFETDTCEESDEWKERTVGKDGKGGVGVDVIASEITGMGLKLDGQAWYFSVDHADTNNIKLDDLEQVVSLLKKKRTYAHNSTGFENVILYTHFGHFLEEMVDTKLLASYVDENDKQGLKHLSKRDLNYEQTTYAETLNGRRGMRDVTGAEVLSYGLDDCITCDSLQNLFQTIMAFEGTLDVFYEVEKDSAFVTSLAFVKGVAFDWERFESLKTENDANIARAEKELEGLLLKVGFGETKPQPMPPIAIKATVSILYETVTGKPFISSARSVKSCLKDIDHPEVKAAVEAGIEAMNELYLKHWKPRAVLNVNSPKQVARLLYDVLEAPIRIVNPATEKMRLAGRREGNPSTDDEAIANAIAFKDVSEDGIACLNKLEEYKGYLTKESLFFSKYPKFVHWKTGRLHCSQTQCGASTRRFTHSAPNLAQLPKKKGKEVRDMLLADPGFDFGTFDFDSQELKLQAEDSKCPEFMSCYLGEVKKDVHSKTGYEVALMQEAEVGEYADFEREIEADNPEIKPFRASGKETNFSTSYLCKAKRLAHMLCVDETTAQAFIDAKDKAFPGLMPHIEKYIALCAKRGYSLSFLGARRHLAKAFAMARTTGEREKVERLAWSYRIQGSGGEQIKVAMSRMWRAGLFKNNDCFPVVTIHDECLAQFRKDCMAELIREFHHCVCMNYANMVIPASSTPKVGTNFGSVKEWDVEAGKLKEK